MNAAIHSSSRSPVGCELIDLVRIELLDRLSNALVHAGPSAGSYVALKGTTGKLVGEPVAVAVVDSADETGSFGIVDDVKHLVDAQLGDMGDEIDLERRSNGRRRAQHGGRLGTQTSSSTTNKI